MIQKKKNVPVFEENKLCTPQRENCIAYKISPETWTCNEKKDEESVKAFEIYA